MMSVVAVINRLPPLPVSALPHRAGDHDGGMLREQWEPEDLVGAWTLIEDDLRLVANKTGASRLGFSLLLKFFEQEGRFPRGLEEAPASAVAYVAPQIGVEPDALGGYSWAGRSIKYHRAQIRETLGFREATREDEAKLIVWLAASA
jgi:Domain of unknown function (DUF4158)